MLITKEVEVKLVPSNIKYYQNLGYKGKMGDLIIVKIEDLSNGSHVLVEVECDYCHEHFSTPYSSYILSIKYIDKNSCKNSVCKNKKTKETTLLRYGVDNTSKLQSMQEKMCNTNMRKYGVPYYMQTTEFKEKSHNIMMEKYGVTVPLKNKELLNKVHKTNMERYGVATPMESDELKQRYEQNCLKKYGVKYPLGLDSVKEKVKRTCLDKYGVEVSAKYEGVREKYKQTCLERYGVDNTLKSPEFIKRKNETMLQKYGVTVPLKNKELKEKTKQTNIEKYGVDNPAKYKEFREKMAKSLYENGTTATSSQQIYLYNLFGGELNYPISYYNVDICLLKDKIIMEYDGGGHDLCVKENHKTQEEFNQKEIKRFYVIKQAGYKQIRIISSKDYLPSDEILLQMLEQAKEYFNTTNHTWIEYNIDSSTMRNAENKEGVYYKYGELRKIKKVS